MSKPRFSKKLAKMQMASYSWAKELVTSIETMASAARNNRKACKYLANLVQCSLQILEAHQPDQVEGDNAYSDYCAALQEIEVFVREAGTSGQLMSRLRGPLMVYREENKLALKLCTAMDKFYLNIKLAHENTANKILTYLIQTCSVITSNSRHTIMATSLLPDIDEAIWYHKNGQYKEALHQFKQHSTTGNAIAQFFVGYYFLTGEYGVPKNDNLALLYLRRSAEQDIVPAQFWLAHACLFRNIYEPELAIKNIQKAAKKHDPYALFWYGDVLLNGEHGVKKDLVESERMFRIAMTKGHLLASFKVMCLEGRRD